MNPLTVHIDIYGVWRTTFFIGMVLGLIPLIYAHLPKIGWVAAIFWFYTMTMALYILEYPGLPFNAYTTAFISTAGQTFAEVLLLPLVVLTFPEKWFKWIWRAFIPIVIFEIICIWFHLPGLERAPSFGAAFIALYLPFAPLWLAVPTVITVLTHHNSTALLILFAELVAWAFIYVNPRYRYPMLLVSVAGIFGLAVYHSHSGHLDGDERLRAWGRYMSWWKNEWVFRVRGVGPGSFMWCSMLIDKFKAPVFLQMHSDWLQILFELGSIGLALAIGTVITAIRNVRRNVVLLAGVFGSIAFGITYHPLRFICPALLVTLIFKEALKPQPGLFDGLTLH